MNPQKLQLNKDNQDLKVYMFTVQGGPMQINVAEDFKAVMAYNDAGAIDMIRKDYIGRNVFLAKKAEVPVHKIIDAINLQVPVAPVAEVPAQRSIEKSAAEFVFGMMLVADKFVKNERDRASIKRILGKIKIDENVA